MTDPDDLSRVNRPGTGIISFSRSILQYKAAL